MTAKVPASGCSLSDSGGSGGCCSSWLVAAFAAAAFAEF